MEAAWRDGGIAMKPFEAAAAAPRPAALDLAKAFL
jgi:hypothetical protein